MEITDEQLLAEAQAMALYIRFAERHIADLEAENATLRAENTQDADQHTP